MLEKPFLVQRNVSGSTFRVNQLLGPFCGLREDNPNSTHSWQLLDLKFMANEPS